MPYPLVELRPCGDAVSCAGDAGCRVRPCFHGNLPDALALGITPEAARPADDSVEGHWKY